MGAKQLYNNKFQIFTIILRYFFLQNRQDNSVKKTILI